MDFIENFNGTNISSYNSSFGFHCMTDYECFGDEYNYIPFKLTPGKVVSAIAIGILMIIALAGNVLVCTAFLCYRRLRKITNYFIVSLAMSDIIVAAIAMPIWLSFEVTGWENLPLWVDFEKIYNFWLFVDIVAGVSSMCNLAAISIDRFFSIVTPLLHRTRMTSTIAIVMIIITWAYSIALASLTFLHLPYYVGLVSTAGFFVPFVIIVVAYCTIYLKVRRSGYGTNTDGGWNLELTLLIVIGLFVVCWTPFIGFTLLFNYCHSCYFHPNTMVLIISFFKWMHYLNSGCNPFIYGLFNTNFKHAFRALLRKCCLSCELKTTKAEHEKFEIKTQLKSLRSKFISKASNNSLLSDLESNSASITLTHTSSQDSPLNNNYSNASGSDTNDTLSVVEFRKQLQEQRSITKKRQQDPPMQGQYDLPVERHDESPLQNKHNLSVERQKNLSVEAQEGLQMQRQKDPPMQRQNYSKKQYLVKDSINIVDEEEIAFTPKLSETTNLISIGIEKDYRPTTNNYLYYNPESYLQIMETIESTESCV